MTEIDQETDARVSAAPPGALSLARIAQTWWPLAASWLLMGLEGPAISAAVARLADPKINLAAYGGLVFPVALIVEAPIIMLLAASTALAKDADSYRKLRLFTHALSAALTFFHLIIVATPLYHFVTARVIGAPAEIIEPARLGLFIMLPWTWSIAYRRFNQGVLIRYGHSLTVGIGTVVRLLADALVLLAGYLVASVPGVAVASAAIMAGVVSEAVYAGIRVRPVVREQVNAMPAGRPLRSRAFLAFYVPLSLTSLLTLAASPIGSAAMSRMPHALESLAIWPAMSGVTFIIRTFGGAYNEVVVALLEKMHSSGPLRRFNVILMGGGTLLVLILVIPAVGNLVFAKAIGLSPALVEIARPALWLALPLPALSVLESWYQGAILHHGRTRGISEAVVIYLVSISGMLTAGVLWGRTTGLYFALAGISFGELLRTLWLRRQSLPARTEVQVRDERPLTTAT